ncbi:ATP-binding cassette domain-containing protein, partial [Candidatus Bipolaricaulota bacterium]|nr:ATP-binding cassette domain-containing protein [Candidatus Bipolaricaulota bacterium]
MPRNSGGSAYLQERRSQSCRRCWMLARLDDVTKLYGRNEGLRDFTIAFPKGEVVGVLGLNGSGKSTMLKL